MDAGGHVHISPCPHPDCNPLMVITNPAMRPEDIDSHPGALWPPGGIIPMSGRAEVRWLPSGRTRPPDIHDVVTWDWPERPPEAPDTAIYWDETDPHKMDHDLYTWRLMAAGWITLDGEVTW